MAVTFQAGGRLFSGVSRCEQEFNHITFGIATQRITCLDVMQGTAKRRQIYAISFFLASVCVFGTDALRSSC